MKVLQMGPYPPPHGGVQTNLVALRNYLLAHGSDCLVINLTRHRREEKDGIYYPKAAWEVARLLLHLDYEIIHLHVGGNMALRHAGMMFLCSLIPGKKTVFTFHSGGYPSSEAGRRARWWSLRGFALRRLDGLIAVNDELADLFHRFGVPSARIRFIPPYCVENPDPETQLPSALENFFRAHDPLLVTVSGLEPEYDLPLQIEALGRLLARFPQMGLAIAGGGSREAEIRDLVAAKAYRDHVLLCGDLPHAVTLCAIRNSDLFLRTTLYDGDSISVREALYLGTPVIATDNGMRPTGVSLIPIGDLHALCRAIEEQLHAPGDRPVPGMAGTENLEAVVAFYRDLCSRR